MMTKKHYEAIAQEINDAKSAATYEEEEDNFDSLATNLADYFASENPKFDRARFLVACGVEQTPCGGQP